MVKIKLKQTEVLEKVKAGWTLNRSMGLNSYWYLTSPDKMGGFPRVHEATGYKICKMKEIKQVSGFPVERFIWVEAHV
jgi:hypothetical protein